MREYCMYFPFFIPKAGGKRSAAQPKTIYSEVPWQFDAEKEGAKPLFVHKFDFYSLGAYGIIPKMTCAAEKGSSEKIGESWRRKILAQPKVLKAEEYFVYFPFSELHGWGKRFAASRRRFFQRFPIPRQTQKEKHMGVFDKIFGTRSQREIKKIQPTVDKILGLEEEYRALSEEALKAKTAEFKNRLEQGQTLDELLPEAFAAVRVAADRVLGMRPYPVQLIGGVVLHQGRIAEMKTGEGKTLVAILPCYLNALTGKGVHVVTVNEYLAKRDSEWMGKVYRYMGLSVGLVIPGMTPAERRVAYAADITYCTNNELGFDYLRDNMAIYKSELVQRGHAFAIVDEVDSILIDEARTPLIISGKGEDSSKLYEMADHFVSTLRKQVFAKTDEKEIHDDYDCDYIVDEKQRTVSLTASGIAKAEKFFGVENLADAENATLSHHINQAMKARGLMKRDIDYVIKDGQIIIVDEFTGRLMYGRRYNEGLHQAIEAKEGVTVAGESKTLATITFQNFFRLYGKLSGMTGTALTEEEEFSAIYNLDVVEIPTNRPVVRIDHPDVVYKTEAGKFRAVIQQVKECHEKGQPVLVGTVSIEKNELLSHLLQREGIQHNLLNAKNHDH